MIYAFALQLPFSVSLVWFVLTLFKRRKIRSDYYMGAILGLFAAVFIMNATHFMSGTVSKFMILTDILSGAFTLVTLPLVCMFIKSLFYDRAATAVDYLLILPSVLYVTSVVLVTCFLGMDRCAELTSLLYSGLPIDGVLNATESGYLWIQTYLFKIIYLLLSVVIYTYLTYVLVKGKFKFSHVFSFFRSKKSSFVSNVLCLLFIILYIIFTFHLFMNSRGADNLRIFSIIASAVEALVIFTLGYVATIPVLPGGYISMERLMRPFDPVNQTRQEYMDTLDSGPISDQPRSTYDKIMESFKDLMEVRQEFLNPAVSIDSVAVQLRTNRTYVSRLVNIYYGMPFRDYLNKLRIDYSRTLILDEPDATIDYIASKSGFQSSTQFIRKFKESEGQTPSVWRSTHSIV